MQLKKLQKILLILSLLCVFPSRPVEKVGEIPPKLKQFMIRTFEYKLNAPWVIDEFMDMNLHEFSAAWGYLVDMMKQPDERWRFFCDRKADYDDDAYYTRWIWQCHFFELWLSKLYVKIEDLSLVYDKNDTCNKPTEYAHIFGCWRTLTEHGQGDFSAIYDFYAFYADCLVHCLLKGIKIAYLEIDTPVYDAAWQTSFSLSEGLKIMVKQLQESDYAPRYGAQLERYSQVLELLKNEKIRLLFRL